MGKHAAPRGRTAATAAPTEAAASVAPEPLPPPTATTATAAAPSPRSARHSPTLRAPRALTQTAAFGALAVVVLVLALAWAGAGARAALALALGVLVIGAIAYLVVVRTGLLDSGGPSEPPADVPPGE